MLAGNPLSTIPNEVLNLGLKAILAYLKELEGGSESYSKVKLMFVGEANVGKTSLVSSFVNINRKKKDRKEVPAQPNIATDGIDIERTSWDKYAMAQT
jgi:GTPase SAR1 family protein